MDVNLADLAPIGLNLLVAALTVAVTVPITATIKNRIDWNRDQRAWRHRQRYEAVVGVLAETRRHEVLTTELRRLRGKKGDFSQRIQELVGRPSDDHKLSEARRRHGVAETKLAKVNDLILDSVTGVNESAVKLRLLDPGEFASLATAISDARVKLLQDGDDGIPLEPAQAAYQQAQEDFVAAAREELQSGDAENCFDRIRRILRSRRDAK